MKPAKSNRFSILLATSGLLVTGSLQAQTVEINPAGAIPAAFNLVQDWGWNDVGVLDGWTANANLTLEVGTPTDDGGGNASVKGTSAGVDPVFTSPTVAIATPYRVIVEMRVKKEATDTTRMDLFWDDTSGGFGSPRVFSVLSTTLVPDDSFKVVRITFPHGKMIGQLDQLRFDPISDAPGVGKTIAIDYLRVYTETPTPLTWDSDTATTDAQGGTGTWDQLTSNLWWDGAANTTWPASGVRAVFGATAGTVTVAGAGVNANIADFQTTGYTVTGGPISIGSDSAKFTNSTNTFNTRIDSPLTGSAPLQLAGGGIFVLGGNNSSLSGPVTLFNGKIGMTNDNAVGTGTVTMGAGGNTFISSLDGDRTLANNVIFAGNRMVTDNDVYGTGLTSGNLIIDGNLALNCTAPADFFLRKNLTVNGVVSGSNSNIGILLAGNAGTLKLTNANNNFTGNITVAFSGAAIEADSDGALGALTNSLRFPGPTTSVPSTSTMTLKMLAGFDSARPIVINNFGTGTAGTTTTLAQINTNGFDSTWTGVISAPAFSAPAVAQQVTSLVKQGAGTLTLDSGGTTANNLRSGGFRVEGGTLKIASGAITTGSSSANGVSGGCFMEINGGSLSTGNFSVGKSAGTATFTLNSGTYINTVEFLVSFNLGNGVVNINGGLADLNNFSMVDKVDLTSTINLNGGTVRLNFFNARFNAASPAAAISNINFNGSTIVAKNNSADFIETNTTTTINALVQAGGAIFNTTNPVNLNANSVTIKQPLLHDPALGATLDGGLTKNGLGTLTLAPVAGPNTYTGPTTVNEGVLAVSGTSIDDLGKLDIVGGKVSIPAATNETVNTLYFNGVQQPAGVYGSSASGAALAFQNDTYFDVAGTGTLTVTSGSAASSYNTWAAAFSSPVLSPSGPTDDADFDGISNAVEYITGGDPRVSSQLGNPTSTTAAGVITFAFNREDNSETPDVTTVVQVSTDLVDWTTLPSYTIGADTASSTAGVVVAENGLAADNITVTIPNTGAAKKFARLTVVVTP